MRKNPARARSRVRSSGRRRAASIWSRSARIRGRNVRATTISPQGSTRSFDQISAVSLRVPHRPAADPPWMKPAFHFCHCEAPAGAAAISSSQSLLHRDCFASLAMTTRASAEVLFSCEDPRTAARPRRAFRGDEAISTRRALRGPRLLRGACPRAAHRADPWARNDNPRRLFNLIEISASSRSGRAWRRSRRRSCGGCRRADGRAPSGCIPANPARCRPDAGSPRPT